MVNTSETKNEKLQNNEATVQVMKQPKTFAQQVEIIKEKGFIIDNDTECIGFLKQANYYRLSAYFLPFRKKDGTYFSNINFHRIQRIYEFDSRLRGVLFNYNEITGAVDKKRKDIKRILKGYTKVGDSLKCDLKAYGFAIEKEGRHYKLIYKGDSRYLFTMAASGSDSQHGGGNLSAEIIRDML